MRSAHEELRKAEEVPGEKVQPGEEVQPGKFAAGQGT